ncbi:NRDE family protein [Alteromonas sp. ASW11-19]|uniref:NRDE family protein n=1 Tax=Alteromonas salexigens TaxID=2982530 RepID=A0ABT2VP52_9ALTE|nr:NRDE family protein [Alteromonas salexigens]MCU7554021.1 NRDE family protein [Alteromonas salexigens]
MCILFIAVKQHADYPLIIAANRDEFYARPTRISQFWDKPPDMLAGKDLQAGGTWMGVTRSGRIAALTNIRAGGEVSQARTRGELVVNALTHTQPDAVFSEQLQRHRHQYNGYNLLYGDVMNLQVYNNAKNTLVPLQPGIHGLSNAHLNAPWPKVTRGMQALTRYTCQHESLSVESLFTLLRDDHQAADHALPDTGIGYEWEKMLSSIFITSPNYGTRASTLLMVDSTGTVQWHERTFSDTGMPDAEQHHTFTLATSGR